MSRLFERLTPPERLRVGPFAKGAFRSRLHEERVAAILGIALGVAFFIGFFTGVISHLVQYPPSWFVWPSRPAGLYRVTQGLHVISGIAAIPLLLAKLWAVYPRFYTWPPVVSVAHLIERISLAPLVAGALFMLFSGVANIIAWYPWGFFFPPTHFWVAWITIGALIIHIGAKYTLARTALFDRDKAEELPGDVAGRRRFLRTAFGASALLTLVTAGQTIRPLSRFGLLAVRDPNVGPQNFPVNKSAASAGVLATGFQSSWALHVEGNVTRELKLSRDDLLAMSQHSARLPIACVEGWSAEALWTGVRVRDILKMAGARPDAAVQVESLQERGLYRASVLSDVHARDRDTLLALKVNGESLHIDHGYPCRLIGPNRPGVMQTKWVSKLIVK